MSTRKSEKSLTVGMLSLLTFGSFLAFSDSAIAGSGQTTIGTVAENITKSLSNIASLVTAGSYVAGFGFAVGAILKFKAHKDNPTQIPVGTPIALLFIAAALIFLPSIFGVAGETMFGSKTGSGGVSGTISF